MNRQTISDLYDDLCEGRISYRTYAEAVHRTDSWHEICHILAGFLVQVELEQFVKLFNLCFFSAWDDERSWEEICLNQLTAPAWGY